MRRMPLGVSGTLALALVSSSCGPPPPDTPLESPSSVLSADGVPIHYEVHGSGEPVLVFVHGWTCDRTYWRYQIPHFSQGHTVVAIDLAGHGDSGLGRDEWSMEAFGGDVAAVVRGLDLPEVVLIGHSMGGPVVAEAARKLGDRVVGVIGVDTFNDLSRKTSTEDLQAIAGRFQADFAQTMKGVVAGMFVPASDPDMANWIAEDMASADSGVGIGALEGMIDWYNLESRDALGELPAPLRLINSDYSPTNVEAALDYAPSVEVTLMSGVGHFVMMEAPETFNSLLSEVISGLLHVSPPTE